MQCFTTPMAGGLSAPRTTQRCAVCGRSPSARRRRPAARCVAVEVVNVLPRVGGEWRARGDRGAPAQQIFRTTIFRSAHARTHTITTHDYRTPIDNPGPSPSLQPPATATTTTTTTAARGGSQTAAARRQRGRASWRARRRTRSRTASTPPSSSCWASPSTATSPTSARARARTCGRAPRAPRCGGRWRRPGLWRWAGCGVTGPTSTC